MTLLHFKVPGSICTTGPWRARQVTALVHVELQQGFQAVCQFAQTNVLVAQNSVQENEMHEVLRFMTVVTEILDGMPDWISSNKSSAGL